MSVKFNNIRQGRNRARSNEINRMSIYRDKRKFINFILESKKRFDFKEDERQFRVFYNALVDSLDITYDDERDILELVNKTEKRELLDLNTLSWVDKKNKLQCYWCWFYIQKSKVNDLINLNNETIFIPETAEIALEDVYDFFSFYNNRIYTTNTQFPANPTEPNMMSLVYKMKDDWFDFFTNNHFEEWLSDKDRAKKVKYTWSYITSKQPILESIKVCNEDSKIWSILALLNLVSSLYKKDRKTNEKIKVTIDDYISNLKSSYTRQQHRERSRGKSAAILSNKSLKLIKKYCELHELEPDTYIQKTFRI